MNLQLVAHNPHRIIDPDCTVDVVSDFHKYSGVSNFSKGDNPFFRVYHALYVQNSLGNIHASNGPLTEEQKREIEKAVRARYTYQDLRNFINAHYQDPVAVASVARNDDGHFWERRQEVFESFKAADHVVLNGDIFDIECSKKPEEKIKSAVEWLKTRIDTAPNTHFHLVLGNHEAFTKFIKAMETLADDPNYGQRFHFHEHYLQINDNLFVHGDEYLGVAKYIKAYQKTAEKKAKGKQDATSVEPAIDIEKDEGARRRKLSDLNPVARTAYEWVNGLYHKGKNMWEGLYHITETLYTGPEKSDTEGLSEAFKTSKHIFSGHTHEPYSIHFKDKYFYNTGAAVKSKFSVFRPLRVHIRSGVTERVEPLLEQDQKKAIQRPLVSATEQSKRYCVLSDLHLFGKDVSRYQNELTIQGTIKMAMDDADVIVLNGDIFDLTYTADSLKAKERALEWLQALMKQYPDKEIHYILGNHEAVDEFIVEVKQLPRQSNRFHFHEHAYQPNEKTIFFHGDEIESVRNFEHRKTVSLSGARALGALQVASRVLEKPALTFVGMLENPRSKAPKAIRALPFIPGVTEVEKIENIFFGHTHVPFVDYAMEGKEYGLPGKKWVTNTGAATNHARFAGVTFMMNEDGSITPPRIIDHTVSFGPVAVNGF